MVLVLPLSSFSLSLSVVGKGVLLLTSLLNYLEMRSSHTYRGHKERDPAHHHEHRRGQIDGEDERAQGSRQSDLEAVNAVVA